MYKLSIFSILLLVLASCSEQPQSNKLPILGERTLSEKEVDGNKVVDTVYHKIADFSFVNQDSTTITQKDVEGKVYVTDFFFTSCPTICPKMKSQLIRVYEKFHENPDFRILSHTIDIGHDTVAVLKDYAEKLEVSSKTWHFLSGQNYDYTYKMAHQYLLAAQKDDEAEGGFDHSGKFILVDGERHIRASCDGTNPEDVDKFMLKIDMLLKESTIK